MLDGIKIDTSSFVSSYTKLKKENAFNKMRLREQLAEANNCTAIGDNSCYADMVAIPKDYNNVVIKICSGDDAFIHYAHFCARGILTGPSHLKVYSETEIAPGVWLFVMERLSRKLNHHEWNMTVDRAIGWYTLPKRGKYAGICKRLREDLNAIKNAFSYADIDYCRDLHRGNVMTRADGTIVYLDPVC